MEPEIPDRREINDELVAGLEDELLRAAGPPLPLDRSDWERGHRAGILWAARKVAEWLRL
jgi:hypothetical protein